MIGLSVGTAAMGENVVMGETVPWTISPDRGAFPMVQLGLEYLAFSGRREAMVDTRVRRVPGSDVFLSGACSTLHHLGSAGDHRCCCVESNTRQTRGKTMCS